MRKDYDLYCIRCEELLPLGSPNDKQYCNGCWKIHKKEYNKELYHKTTYKRNLRKFYDFQRIPLIQSPYFTERRILKVKIKQR